MRVGLVSALAVLVVSVCPGADAQPGQTGARVFVAPTGNDGSCARASAARPCATIGRAYELARCGDAVEIRAGSYGPQRIREVPRLSSCATNVVIGPAGGATVVLDRVDFGATDGFYATDVPDRVTLRAVRVVNGLVAWGDGNDLVWDRIDGGAFWVQGVRNILIRGGDWGPCGSGSDGTCMTFFSRQVVIANDPDEPTETQGVVLEGNSIHDFTITHEDHHFECIRTDGGRDITLRGNRFDRCETYALTITQPRGRWVIEGNWFGRTCCAGGTPPVDRSSAIVLGDGTAGATVAIRRNTFGPKQTVVSEGASGFATVAVSRNVLQSVECLPDVKYDTNLFVRVQTDGRTFEPGWACAGTDRLFVYGYLYDGQRLRPDGRRAAAVRSLFAAVAAGTPLRKLPSLARKVGPSPPGGWNSTTVMALLRDDVYLGSRLGIPDRHPALVTRTRWASVQRTLRR